MEDYIEMEYDFNVISKGKKGGAGGRKQKEISMKKKKEMNNKSCYNSKHVRKVTAQYDKPITSKSK